MSHLRMCIWHVPPGAATGGDCARDLRDAGLVAKGRARYPQGRAAGTGSRMRKTVDVVILGAGIAGLWTCARLRRAGRSEEHTSELQSLMRSSYAGFCLTTTRSEIGSRRYGAQ